MTESQLSWLAGIMEGEGSFFLSKKKRKDKNDYFYPKVSIEMVDEDVLKTIRDIVGKGVVQTSANPRKQLRGWKTSYKLCWEGSTAVTIMTLLLPHMHSRRETKIMEVLRGNEEERLRARANFMASRATSVPRRKA